MLSQPKAKEAFDSFSPKDTITPPEEDKLDNDLQKETTVLGVSPPHIRRTLREILLMYPNYSGSGSFSLFSVWLQANGDMAWGLYGKTMSSLGLSAN